MPYSDKSFPQLTSWFDFCQQNCSLILFPLVIILGLIGASCIRPLTPKETDTATKAKVQAAYVKLPLHFEANQGQSDSQVKFLSRGSGYTLFLTSTEAVLALRKLSKNSFAPVSGGESTVIGDYRTVRHN